MLTKTPIATPTTTFSRIHGKEVRLSTGLNCPHCTRLLQAHDVRSEPGGDIWLACGECHRVLLLVGAPQ
jgi:hypothetical protein